MSLDAVALGGVTDMTDMDMTRQEEISADPGQMPHSHCGPAHQGFFCNAFRHIKGMMRDDDSDEMRRQRPQALDGAPYLVITEAPAAPDDERSRRVQTHHGNLIIDERRLDVVSDVVSIRRERRQKPRRDVIQRHVVITGNGQLPERQRVEKRSRRDELAASSALSEITGNSDQIRRRWPKCRSER